MFDVETCWLDPDKELSGHDVFLVERGQQVRLLRWLEGTDAGTRETAVKLNGYQPEDSLLVKELIQCDVCELSVSDAKVTNVAKTAIIKIARCDQVEPAVVQAGFDCQW